MQLKVLASVTFRNLLICSLLSSIVVACGDPSKSNFDDMPDPSTQYLLDHPEENRKRLQRLLEEERQKRLKLEHYLDSDHFQHLDQDHNDLSSFLDHIRQKTIEIQQNLNLNKANLLMASANQIPQIPQEPQMPQEPSDDSSNTSSNTPSKQETSSVEKYPEAFSKALDTLEGFSYQMQKAWEWTKDKWNSEEVQSNLDYLKRQGKTAIESLGAFSENAIENVQQLSKHLQMRAGERQEIKEEIARRQVAEMRAMRHQEIVSLEMQESQAYKARLEAQATAVAQRAEAIAWAIQARKDTPIRENIRKEMTAEKGQWAARETIERWSRLSYEDRRTRSNYRVLKADIQNHQMHNLPNRYSLLEINSESEASICFTDRCIIYPLADLESDLKNLIKQVTENDQEEFKWRIAARREREAKARSEAAARAAERKRNDEITDQWASSWLRERRYESALEENMLPITAGIKLFPIYWGDTVYARTSEEDMKWLSLRDHSSTSNAPDNLFKIEAFNPEQPEMSRTLIADRVNEIELIIGCHRRLSCNDNKIKYKSRRNDSWQEYPLKRLINYQNTRTVYQIQITPLSQEKDATTQVRWKVNRRNREINQRYRGYFRIAITKRGKKDNNKREEDEIEEWSLINDIPLEHYVQSVVASEIYSRYAMDTHKAQAIAARTYALWWIRTNRRVHPRGWDMGPNTAFQAYRGFRVETWKGYRSVLETLGEVLTYNGRVAFTEYHACSRSYTKTDERVAIFRRRNTPDYVNCGNGESRFGHGRGLPQQTANALITNGWDTSKTQSRPTRNAKYPANYEEPWSYKDVLLYFYDGVEIQDYKDL